MVVAQTNLSLSARIVAARDVTAHQNYRDVRRLWLADQLLTDCVPPEVGKDEIEEDQVREILNGAGEAFAGVFRQDDLSVVNIVGQRCG